MGGEGRSLFNGEIGDRVLGDERSLSNNVSGMIGM